MFIVDDHEDCLRSLALLVRCFGHETRLFSCGTDLIRALRTTCPDAVLLDIGMPHMSGYEVAEWIRRQPRLEDLPIFAVTGYVQESDREHARSCGITRHFAKPIDHPQFLAAIALLTPRTAGQSNSHWERILSTTVEAAEATIRFAPEMADQVESELETFLVGDSPADAWQLTLRRKRAFELQRCWSSAALVMAGARHG